MDFKKVFLSIAIPTLIGFFGIALSAWSSTTIGTDISTTGALTASTTAAGSDITLRAMDDMFMSAVDTLDMDVKILDFNASDADSTMAEFIDPSADSWDMELEGENIYYTVRADTTSDNGFAQMQVAGQAGDFSFFEMRTESSAGTRSSLYVDPTLGTLDIAGGADELTVGTNAVTVSPSAEFYPPKSATPPVACAAGKSGAVYYDTNLNEPCFCNATDWKKFSDASTTCS